MPAETPLLRALAGIGIDQERFSDARLQRERQHYLLTERQHKRRYESQVTSSQIDDLHDEVAKAAAVQPELPARTTAPSLSDPWLAGLQRRWRESDPAMAAPATTSSDSAFDTARHDARHQLYDDSGGRYPAHPAARDGHRQAAFGLMGSHTAATQGSGAAVARAARAPPPRGCGCAPMTGGAGGSSDGWLRHGRDGGYAQHAPTATDYWGGGDLAPSCHAHLTHPSLTRPGAAGRALGGGADAGAAAGRTDAAAAARGKQLRSALGESAARATRRTTHCAGLKDRHCRPRARGGPPQGCLGLRTAAARRALAVWPCWAK